jgi:hypothetical protein
MLLHALALLASAVEWARLHPSDDPVTSRPTKPHALLLKGRTPDEVVRSRLAAEPKLANRRYKPADSDGLPLALQVVAAAKEVSCPLISWCETSS